MARRKKTIKPINLDATVNALLQEYGDDIFEALKESVNDVSKEAVRKLQAVDSFGARKTPHITGAYSKDWTFDDVPVGRLRTKRVVHNEDHYRLAHLLEKGHVIKNGTGRTFGRTTGKEHIKPVNDWANEELPKLVESKIKKI